MSDESGMNVVADAQLEQAVSQAVDAVTSVPEEDSTTLVLSSGAVVRVKRISERLIQRVWMQFERPKPPMVKIEQGGKTWMEPNYDDPVYADEERRYQLQLIEAMKRIFLLRGMEIVKLPEGQPPYEEDTTWESELEAIGLDVPESGPLRYLEWLYYRIAPLDDDALRVQEAINKLAGVSQEDIDAAMASFRRDGR